jgi:hypothetical protein
VGRLEQPGRRRALRDRRRLPAVGRPAVGAARQWELLLQRDHSGLAFYAPPDTRITNYKLILHHYWYAPGNGGPDETTYEALGFSGTYIGGAGQFESGTQQALANEGHWYGWVGNVAGGPVDAVDTGAITRTLAIQRSPKGWPMAMR